VYALRAANCASGHADAEIRALEAAARKGACDLRALRKKVRIRLK
jgi:hypothetical protein